MPAITASHTEYALERLAGNVDEFANWLAGECIDQTRVDSEWFLRSPERLHEAPTAALVKIAFAAPHSASALERAAAAALLWERYTEASRELLRRWEDEAADADDEPERFMAGDAQEAAGWAA